MENLKITDSIQQNLLSATKWLKFLAILGTIGMVLLAIVGVCFLFIPESNGVNGVMLAIIYFFMVALYYYPVKKCFDIVKGTREAMNEESQNALELCAEEVHALLKYFGILSIVCIAIYALVIVIAIICAIIGGANMI